MGEFRPVPVTFKNKGIVQKLSPDLAEPGHFHTLDNFDSDAEGALVSSRGSTDTGLGASMSPWLVHSIARFRPTSTASSQRYYFGHGNYINRINGDASGGSDIYCSYIAGDRRFDALSVDPGNGSQYMFIAHMDAMLKDTGSLGTLQRWGILPPALPASAVAITPTAIDVPTGDAGADLVLTASEAGWADANYTCGTVDLSRGGRSEDAYSSEDPVHIQISIGSPEVFTDIRLQLDVSSTPGSFADYYEKAILPSGLAGYLAGLDSSQDAYDAELEALYAQLSQEQSNYDYGSQYRQEEIRRQIEQLQAAYVSPSSGSYADDVYVQKNQFLAVGAAGSTRDWRHVNAIRIKANTTGAGTVTIAKIELEGGSGLNSESGGRVPYHYRYCFRNPVTGTLSNPSVETIKSRWTPSNRQTVRVTMGSSTDAQVTGSGSIAVYRAGGALGDGLYRLVGFAENGSYPATVTFDDTVADADLAKAELLQEDNDPPVISTLPQSFIATMSAERSPNTTGLTALAVTVLQPAGKDADDVLRAGTTVFINGEPVIVQSVSGNNVTCAPQNGYPAGVQMTCGSVAGQPCHIACHAYDSMFLAGDANNPGVLYRSKKGRPEAFPVQNAVTGSALQVRVSEPSNPIQAIFEAGNGVGCLCLNGIKVVPLWGDAMRSAEDTPAQRGLIAPRAWCKGPDGAIWYLSYDGVYSWAGGVSQLQSYAIDAMFKGKTLNGYKPIDLTDQYVAFGCSGATIRISCQDTDHNPLELLYDLIENRWTVRRVPLPAGKTQARTGVYLTEKDTGRILAARAYGTGGGWDSVYVLSLDSSDGAELGTSITSVCQMPFFTAGEPALQKVLGDIVVDLDNSVPVTVKVYYDWDLSAPDETLTIPVGPGRRWSYPLPIAVSSSKTPGHEFRAVALRFELTTSARQWLYNVTYSVGTLANIQRGRVVDWTTLGWQHDKRLEQLVLVYDTKGQSVTLDLDIVNGISGNTETDSVASFTITGAGRSTVTLPIKATSDGSAIVAKLVRLRSTTPTNPIVMIEEPQILFEKYPPDIIYHTKLTASGYGYLKYYEQLVLDVDTGGVAASVAIEVDGTVKQTVSVTTTAGDRVRSITLDPSISGRLARIRVTPGMGGKFQLFSDEDGLFVVSPADKGAVIHTWDWDELGHPWDKKLKTVTVEYEVTSNTSIQIDRLCGLTGNQSIVNLQTIALKTGGRRKENYVMEGAPIAKMVRLYPTATNADFKYWKYVFDKEDYPADSIPETPHDDVGYPWEKILRAITLSVDTGGVAASCDLYADGAKVFTFSVSSTDATRAQIITPDYNIIGKIFWIVPTPNVAFGGKFQLFKAPLYTVVPEPPPLTKWSSYELVFGYDGIKVLKMMWVEYMCSAGITVKVYVDGGTLFYTKSLPAHTKRDVERFFFPVVNGGVLNKSKVYKVEVESGNGIAPFKMYRDGTRVNSKPLNADQRACYLQHQLWELLANQPA